MLPYASSGPDNSSDGDDGSELDALHLTPIIAVMVMMMAVSWMLHLVSIIAMMVMVMAVSWMHFI